METKPAAVKCEVCQAVIFEASKRLRATTVGKKGLLTCSSIFHARDTGRQLEISGVLDKVCGVESFRNYAFAPPSMIKSNRRVFVQLLRESVRSLPRLCWRVQRSAGERVLEGPGLRQNSSGCLHGQARLVQVARSVERGGLGKNSRRGAPESFCAASDRGVSFCRRRRPSAAQQTALRHSQQRKSQTSTTATTDQNYDCYEWDQRGRHSTHSNASSCQLSLVTLIPTLLVQN